MRPLVMLAALMIAGSCKRSETPRDPATTASVSGSDSPRTTPGSTGAPSGQSEAITGPHVILRPPSGEPVTVRVEVQTNNRTRSSGLMYRRELDEHAGMIFVFPNSEHQVFWMRNTFLPLDMIFITPERRVLGVVRNATPMTDDQREVCDQRDEAGRCLGDSQYVLEVRAGFADRHHITPGTRVEMVNVPPAEE